MGLYWTKTDSETKAWNHTLSETDFAEIKKMLNTLDASTIAGNSGTIHKCDGWRVDLQNPTSDAYNVQVQKNGVPNPSSVAGVLVPFTYSSSIGSVHSTDQTASSAAKKRAEQLRYAVHGALIQSAATLSPKTNAKGNVVQGQYVITMQRIGGQYNH